MSGLLMREELPRYADDGVEVQLDGARLLKIHEVRVSGLPKRAKRIGSTRARYLQGTSMDRTTSAHGHRCCQLTFADFLEEQNSSVF